MFENWIGIWFHISFGHPRVINKFDFTNMFMSVMLGIKLLLVANLIFSIYVYNLHVSTYIILGT